jgi:hypothetical protein
VSTSGVGCGGRRRAEEEKEGRRSSCSRSPASPPRP